MIWLIIYLVGAVLAWLGAYRWLSDNMLTFSLQDLRWGASVLALLWPVLPLFVLWLVATYYWGKL